MTSCRATSNLCRVALLAEGVDRNSITSGLSVTSRVVALLAEGVDRNWLGAACGGGSCVALLAEGVDRNRACQLAGDHYPESPSSRRAWIEILRPICGRCNSLVALLAEGVDRNHI